MSRTQVATGIVGVVVGFIVGFFAGQVAAPETIREPVQAEGLPQDHPSPEAMARLQTLTERAESDPQDRASRVELGNVFYDMGRFDAAIRWYEEALGLDFSDVSVVTDLGTSYLYTKQYEKALEMYQKSLAIQPDHPQTMQNLGIAFFTMANYGEAIKVWEKLLESNPGYAHAEDVRRQIETARLHLNSGAASP